MFKTAVFGQATQPDLKLIHAQPRGVMWAYRTRNYTKIGKNVGVTFLLLFLCCCFFVVVFFSPDVVAQ